MNNPDSPITRYHLVGLSESQTQVLKESLEFYTRIHLGQLEAMEELFRFRGPIENRGDYDLSEHLDNCEQALAHLQEAKRLLTGLHPHQSKGLGQSSHLEANIAFDLMKVVRHRLAWERSPEGGMQVCFDDPYLLNYSGEPKVAMLAQKCNSCEKGIFIDQEKGSCSLFEDFVAKATDTQP